MITAMFAYNQGSEGGFELAKALGVPRVKHNGSKFKGSKKKVILNWGATSDRFPIELTKCEVINPPSKVERAVDKLQTFEYFKEYDVSHPEWTRDRNEAYSWLEGGSMVFARTQLRSHSGRGIVIMDPEHPDTWEISAQLYVKYVPKKYEYRVHVMKGVVIDTQRKGLREELRGSENINFKVRNLANGFVYVRNDGHIVPDIVLSTGVAAVNALGLDFGAADVIYNERQEKAYALEVNTAPGLAGTTVGSYVDALATYF